MKIKSVALKDLLPWPGNARKHNARNLAQIDSSLKSFGQVEPLVVQASTMRVIGGNGRLQAMLAAGDTSADVHLLELDDTKANALNIALNRTAELAEWDDEALNAQLQALEAEGVPSGELGFDEAEMAELAGGNSGNGDPDDVPEPPAESWVKPGDIFELGAHRLMCGSCDEIAKLVPAGTGALLVTDPPYGVSYADKNRFLNRVAPAHRNQEPILEDHHTSEEMEKLWTLWFTGIRQAMGPGSAYYVTGPQGGDLLLLLLSLRASGFPLRHMLVWAKNNFVLGRCDYHYQHEPIIYGWVEGAGHHQVENRSETSLWEIPKPQKSDLHPTMKPVELYRRAIENSSKPGAIVVEPFSGSGTSIIACEMTGRVCRATELAPHYVQVAIERWEKFTGKAHSRIAS